MGNPQPEVPMNLIFAALPTETVTRLRAGGLDANGQPPERTVSDGGNPCRHCLAEIEAGEPMLILAHRPFPAAQPYAEIGPIFLHAGDCPRHADSPGMPAMFAARDRMMVRGYGADDRIVYGTGQVVETARLEAVCRDILADPRVAYLHLRSAKNNCYQARVDRAA
jgi:hypothetical protein